MYQRRRARLVLIVMIIAALVLVTIDFRAGDDGDGPLDAVRDVVTSVFRPVQDGLTTLVRPLGDAASSVTDIFAVRSENERLRAQVEALSERHRSFDDLERENTELRELLEFRDRTELDTIPARVVALGPSYFEWTVTLDAGTNDGVERNMPVIGGDGLVGRVLQVTPSASRVLLAIDPNFSATARTAEDGEVGTVTGRGGEPMLFNPHDPDAEIEVGDEIVTSTFDGGLYPAGIPIGVASHVGDTSTGLVQEVQVRPFVDFARLDHVLIVTTSPTEEIPPLDSTEDLDFQPPSVGAGSDDEQESDGDAQGDEADAGSGDPDDVDDG